MDKEKIKEIAEQIVALENQYNQGSENAEDLLEKLITSISIEDMLEIDDYIYQNNLLT